MLIFASNFFCINIKSDAIHKLFFTMANEVIEQHFDWIDPNIWYNFWCEYFERASLMKFIAEFWESNWAITFLVIFGCASQHINSLNSSLFASFGLKFISPILTASSASFSFDICWYLLNIQVLFLLGLRR